MIRALPGGLLLAVTEHADHVHAAVLDGDRVVAESIARSERMARIGLFDACEREGVSYDASAAVLP